VEAVLRVSIDRKSAYIKKSVPVVKRRTGPSEVPAASKQNRHRVIIPPPPGRPKGPSDSLGAIELIAEDSGAMSKRNRLIMGVSAIVAPAPALASGFGFYENGAKASAQGGAWGARADDASANWYNPAALAHLAGREVQFGLNYLEVGSDTQFSPAPGASFDAVSNTETPAHFYFSQKINDRVAWGVGLNSPFGLVSEWKDEPVVFFSRRAELRTYLLNPNIAFKLSEQWSLAFGVDYLSAEIREFSHDEFITTAVAPAGGPPPTLTTDLSGEGDAWGYNFAVQFKMRYFSLGGQYRSGFRPRIQGDITIGGSPGPDASADVSLPAQTMLGAAWTGNRVDVEAGGYYTQWNAFKRLDIETGNPSTDAHLTENWIGTWSYRLGLAFRLGNEMKHELRVGGVLDKTPIPVEFLRPSIPDSDRTGYSLGYGYLSTLWGIDVYAMHLQFDDVTANGSPSDAVINGTYASSILLAGVTAKYRF
jgi:long-chain fatty acid transport protein